MKLESPGVVSVQVKPDMKAKTMVIPSLSIFFFFYGKDDPNNSRLSFYEFKQSQQLKSVFLKRSGKSPGPALMGLVWLSNGTD